MAFCTLSLFCYYAVFIFISFYFRHWLSSKKLSSGKWQWQQWYGEFREQGGRFKRNFSYLSTAEEKMMMSKARFKGATFCLPLVSPGQEMYSWKNCSPISTEHLHQCLSKNASQSSYQGIFLPRCTGHATDQNAEYIAKDDNLVFLQHNKDM